MTGYDLIMNKGIEKGIEIGASEEKQKNNRTFATSLLVSTDFNDEKIATLVGVEKAYVSNLRAELKK